MRQLQEVTNLVADYAADIVDYRINVIKHCLIEIMKKPFIFDNSKMAIIIAEKLELEVSADDVAKARDIYRSLVTI